MSDTDVVYGTLPAYALATPSPVLTLRTAGAAGGGVGGFCPAIALRLRYALSGPDVVYAATRLCCICVLFFVLYRGRSATSRFGIFVELKPISPSLPHSLTHSLTSSLSPSLPLPFAGTDTAQ
eukprot:1891867-Rhodomonas_salina.2